ncbi:MAG: hypothetical protein P1V97_15930 [Planctomycetota bacterium]|nr:hypothetical protein [Planctomycetota bacterium]
MTSPQLSATASHKRHRSRSLVLFGLLLILLSQTPPKSEAGRSRVTIHCPVDGTVHLALITISRNQSGGRDSDGCVYSIEGNALTVHALDDVITCPSCLYSCQKRDLKKSINKNEGQFSPRQKRLVLKAVKDSGIKVSQSVSNSESIPVATRHRLSVVCYKALSEDTGQSTGQERFYASLLLQSAWIERGLSVSQGGLSSFRPSDLKDGLKQYQGLKNEVGSLQHPSIREIRSLERVLQQLDSLQGRVNQQIPAHDAVERFRKQELERAFLKIEAELRQLKEEAKGRADKAAAALMSNEGRTLQLRLAQAALRLGLRAEREQSLKDLKRETLPRPLSLALAALEQHIKNEEILIREALGYLKQVPKSTEDGGEEVQLLKGDLWRRLGENGKARACLKGLNSSKKLWIQQRAKLLNSLMKDG